MRSNNAICISCDVGKLMFASIGTYAAGSTNAGRSVAGPQNRKQVCERRRIQTRIPHLSFYKPLLSAILERENLPLL